MSAEHNFYYDFTAGWIGGIGATVLSHPMETIKVRQQIMNAKLLYSVKNTYKAEGIRGFYKGMLFPIVTMGPSNSIFFGVYGNTMRVLQGNKSKTRIIEDDAHFMRHICIAGATGGFVQALINCPIEVVKVNLQASMEGSGWKKHHSSSNYTGMMPAIIGIYKKQGFFGFYRGLAALILRDVPVCCPYTMIYEYITHLPQMPENIFIEGMAGGIAGATAWSIVLPFDVAKARIQTDDPNNPKYKGVLDCLKQTYKAEGLQALFKGFIANNCWIFTFSAATFVFYEEVLTLMYYLFG